MADPSLGDTYSTLHTTPTVATSGFALTLGPANNFLSLTDASVMAQFSMDLRELEAVSALSDLSQVPETQLNSQALMHELSIDSEVTFRISWGLPRSCQLYQVSIRLRKPGPCIHRRTVVAYSLRL